MPLYLSEAQIPFSKLIISQNELLARYSNELSREKEVYLMQLINLLHKLSDLPLRNWNYVKRSVLKSSPFSSSSTKSDSEGTFYEKAVENILASESHFKRFRRKYNYREILEHVDFKLGQKYFFRIKQLDPKMRTAQLGLTRNDLVGSPRSYKYPHFEKISPTTLRYISVALDIQNEIDIKRIHKIVEIGAGYGGQAAILDRFIPNLEYFIFDLPLVQKLIDKYLSSLGMRNFTHMSLADSIPSREFDLVISNYAFSELPRNLQIEYLEKVLLKSKNGYLIMNSGRGNSTGRSTGKLSLEEISDRIPGLMVKEEIPLTSPDNYVIYWRAN
jgi:putative sugar O-methyltransferase